MKIYNVWYGGGWWVSQAFLMNFSWKRLKMIEHTPAIQIKWKHWIAFSFIQSLAHIHSLKRVKMCAFSPYMVECFSMCLPNVTCATDKYISLHSGNKSIENWMLIVVSLFWILARQRGGRQAIHIANRSKAEVKKARERGRMHGRANKICRELNGNNIFGCMWFFGIIVSFCFNRFNGYRICRKHILSAPNTMYAIKAHLLHKATKYSFH